MYVLWHLVLTKVEAVDVPRECLHELTGKDPTITAVVLLWYVLLARQLVSKASEREGKTHLVPVVNPVGEVELRLPLRQMFCCKVRSQPLRVPIASARTRERETREAKHLVNGRIAIP